MKSTRTTTMLLLAVFVAGSALARIYYFKLMIVRGLHRIALEQLGLVGYWLTIAVPAMVIAALAYFCWPRSALPANARILLSLPIGIAAALVGLLACWLVGRVWLVSDNGWGLLLIRSRKAQPEDAVRRR